jgi:DNA-binding LacI/PurR family transcriptional regulator
MSHPHRPTAIIAADHPMAAAVLSAATDLGLRVPHDLSVVAFAGMRGDPSESPAMTSIEISTEDIVRATLSALHIGRERKNSQALNPLRVLTRLVIRQSTDQIRSVGEHPAIL